MAKNSRKSDEETGEFPRRVSTMVVYLHPFRLVEAEGQSKWEVTIDDVNKGTWDYIKLHEVAGAIDVGLQSPYNLLVARDGALALPPIPELRTDQKAVEFFNRCLAAFLLGGVYCESVSLDNLEFGSIIDWKFVRVDSNAQASANRFHNLARLRMASPIEAIELLNPRVISLSTLEKAIAIGLSVFNAIPNLSGEFLLKGTTGIARRDWGVALSNLWIVVEQITQHLWDREIIAPAQIGNQIDGRRDQLNDTRTWTTAARLELMYQREILPIDALRFLSLARKARNALSHRGDHPDENAAMAGYRGVQGLLQIALPETKLPLYSLDLADHALSDPFKPRESKQINPEYWLPIPKLPGEEELEREEAKTRPSRKPKS